MQKRRFTEALPRVSSTWRSDGWTAPEPLVDLVSKSVNVEIRIEFYASQLGLDRCSDSASAVRRYITAAHGQKVVFGEARRIIRLGEMTCACTIECLLCDFRSPQCFTLCTKCVCVWVYFCICPCGLWVSNDQNRSVIALAGPEERECVRQRFDKWTFATLMECENVILIIWIDHQEFNGLIFDHTPVTTAAKMWAWAWLPTAAVGAFNWTELNPRAPSLRPPLSPRPSHISSLS